MKKEDKPNSPVDNLGSFPSRTFCAALEDMRNYLTRYEVQVMAQVSDEVVKEDLLKPIYGIRTLIEEVQAYGNRMESHLDDSKEESKRKKEHKEKIVFLKKVNFPELEKRIVKEFFSPFEKRIAKEIIEITTKEIENSYRKLKEGIE